MAKQIIIDANERIASIYIDSIRKDVVNPLNYALSKFEEMDFNVRSEELIQAAKGNSGPIESRYQDEVVKDMLAVPFIGKEIAQKALVRLNEVLDFIRSAFFGLRLKDGSSIEDHGDIFEIITFEDDHFVLNEDNESMIRESFVKYVTTKNGMKFAEIQAEIAESVQKLFDLFADRRTPSFMFFPMTIFNNLFELKDDPTTNKTKVVMKKIDFDSYFES